MPGGRPDPRSPEAQEYRKLRNTAAWKRLRARHLDHNPLCAMCEQEGRITAATVVDHIIPHKADAALFYDSGNLRSLCKLHHDSTKQAQERGSERRLIGADGWPVV